MKAKTVVKSKNPIQANKVKSATVNKPNPVIAPRIWFQFGMPASPFASFMKPSLSFFTIKSLHDDKTESIKFIRWEEIDANSTYSNFLEQV